MVENTLVPENISKAAPAGQPKGGRKRAKKAKAAKRPVDAKKARTRGGDRSNKKGEVIAIMKRPKGATLAEIMHATKWQAHTVRGFISNLGKKGDAKVESSKNAAGERTYKIAK